MRLELSLQGSDEQLLDSLLHYYCDLLQVRALQRPQCGIWLQPSTVAHQLMPLLAELTQSDQVDVLVIISITDASEHSEWLLRQGWCDYPLLVCHDSQFGRLTALQLLFAQESIFTVRHSWPCELIKIGLPHGVDIPLKKTLTEYGGCLEFDYVLSARPQPLMPSDSFVNRYPSTLRQHSRPFVAEIPFGFVKYDHFFRRRQNCTAADTALIYHISNLALEMPWVQHQLRPTIALLLEQFTDYKLIFRPFPADINHPAVVACRQTFASHPRFIFSDAPSYVDDYCTGALMICHRVYQEHLFPLVTGRSQIVYQPAEPRDTAAAIATTAEQLITRVQAELDNIRVEPAGLIAANPVFHPGCSARYLLDNLHFILHDQKHPEWRYFALDCGLTTDTVLQQAVAGALAFNKLALAASLREPERLDYQLLVLESLVRVPVQLQDSTLALLYWRKAMSIAAELLCHMEQQGQPTQLLDSWMYQRGLPVLLQMMQLMHQHSVGLNQGEQKLLQYYRPQSYQRWPVQRLFAVIATQDGTELTGGEVILYGAGQLAQEFIAEQLTRQRYQVVAVVDSAPHKWQQQIAGVTIQSPQLLQSCSLPIIICSRAFAEEICGALQDLPGVDKRLYRVL
ncbi:nucleoside-diphosphate sugar epimerase/dehydratase [Rheinheimera marina]|uniref:Nucleoside-diphosphate sugar epimerase/dehydratase n=1 Tax=Rheinheimera marina TaxID=1774958 RepID=A0ABV9JRN6_9GAMM